MVKRVLRVAAGGKKAGKSRKEDLERKSPNGSTFTRAGKSQAGAENPRKPGGRMPKEGTREDYGLPPLPGTKPPDPSLQAPPVALIPSELERYFHYP